MIERETEAPALAGEAAEEGLAIAAAGLTKTYGEVEAVRGIDLGVRPGETFGFLGPNGAGKSTTIGMLCTLVTPTAGSARWPASTCAASATSVRRNIGLVFQDTTLDDYLTAEENLRFHAELYGVPRGSSASGCSRCWRWSVCGSAASTVKTFSGGMKRRLRSPGDCCTPRGCSSSTSRRSGSTPRPALHLGLHQRVERREPSRCS